MKESTKWLLFSLIISLMLGLQPASAKLTPQAVEEFKKSLQLSEQQHQSLQQLDREYQVKAAAIHEQYLTASKQMQEWTQRHKGSTTLSNSEQQELNSLRQKQMSLLQQIQALGKQKQDQTMAVLSPQQRAKWLDFYRSVSTAPTKRP